MGQFIGGLPLINLLGDSDGLGVTVFSNNADVLTPVTPLGPKRQDVLNLINQISASGNTLLFDTIAAQFDALNKLPSKHIKAVIVLTDGMDNISQHSLDQLVSQITPVGENAGNSIKVFTIAYGSDADVSGLTKIANATAGQEYAGTPQNIKQVQGARCIYKSQIADQRILLTNRSMPALLRTSSRCKVQGAFTNRKSQITNHKSQIADQRILLMKRENEEENMSHRLLQCMLVITAVMLIVLAAGCGSSALTYPSTVNNTATTNPQTNNTVTATVQATGTVTSRTIKTVFLILMENHNWSDIKGSSSAPYINNTILPMASYTQQYYNPPANHPSEPNYLWLEAGTNFNILNDDDPSANHQSTKQHLVTLLSNANLSWKSYQEGISGKDCPLTENGVYAPKHNPMVFFDDVTNTNDPNSATCIAHVRPYRELAGDLQNNTQASYNFITPSLCDDMHDTCAPFYDSVKQGDTWLQQNLPTILNSQAYQNGGVIFITWDEGEGSDGPIGMIVLSNDAKGGGYSNTIPYTHSSTLRTIEEIFGVSPLLGDAANATDLRDLFKTFP